MTILTALLLSLASGCAQLDRMIADISGSPPPGNLGGGGAGTASTIRTPGEAPPPIFGDWWYLSDPAMKRIRKPTSGDPCLAVPRFNYPDENTYVPVNIPGAGHGGPSFVAGGWYNWFARCYTNNIAASGAPVAVLIRSRNCPFPYATAGFEVSPGEVPAMLDTVPRLDYLFMDLEPIKGGTDQDVIRNAEAIVRMVREHPNPSVSNAYIGNYSDWPGVQNEASIWPNKRDRTRIRGRWNKDSFYRSNFNVAMPVAYPYETYSRHSDQAIQKGPTTPSDRAAMLWAPVERVSAAARNLPDGHLLIPWISNFVEYDEDGDVYNAPPPSKADLEALVRHIRMRGAHSYMVWTSDATRTDHPTIGRMEFRELAMNAWRSLNPAFADGESVTLMNLETDKSSGIVWSGVVGGGRAWVLVSNLSPRAVSVDLPSGSLSGLPDRTPEVPPGQHRLYRFPIGG